MEKKFYFTKEYDDAVYSLSYIAFQIFKYIKVFLKPYHYKIILISKKYI